MFDRIFRLFRPLDTTAVDQAIEEACKGHHDVRVRARALRMDIGCGNPVLAVRRFLSTAGDGLLASRFPLDRDTPPDMLRMIDTI